MSPDKSCPCDPSRAYTQCCGRFIDGGQRPETAEQLMRSRYSAFALGREDYLLLTWHDSTRPPVLDLARAPVPKWLGLSIVRCEAGGPTDDDGVVDFVARFKVGGKAERLHEVSRFRREAGQWFYVDGRSPDGRP
jgi:SEC-C motif-containing protein